MNWFAKMYEIMQLKLDPKEFQQTPNDLKNLPTKTKTDYK